MASDEGRCPVCGETASNTLSATECPRCGRYRITRTAAAILNNNPLKEREIANASAWLRENQGATLADRDVDFLRTLRAPTVHDRAMKVLQEIARRFPQVGEEFDTNNFLPRFPGDVVADRSWLAVSWSAQFDELNYLY